MKVLKNYWMAAVITLLWLPPLPVSAKAPVNVQVSILPQKYCVERIGKDFVNVDVLVKPGKSPEIYSPSPDQIKKLVSANIYFRIGIDFETGLMDKIQSVAGLKIVDTREGITLRDMEAHPHKGEDHDAGHAEGEDQNHDAGHHEDQEHRGYTGKDPHIWMSPENIKIQAHTIFQALVEIDPESRDVYQVNYDAFVKDIGALDLQLKDVFRPLQGENLFVFHPAFGYLTDRYGLTQIAVETMGKAPKGKELSNIIKLAKKEKARVIFVQPQFDQSAAEKIASAINGVVVSIDPLAYDYIANMEIMADTIAKALK
jgi:zinc transport system substrate-binding protein